MCGRVVKTGNELSDWLLWKAIPRVDPSHVSEIR